jgi:hypothetical protein
VTLPGDYLREMNTGDSGNRKENGGFLGQAGRGKETGMKYTISFLQ